MALPETDVVWPPTECQHANSQYKVWGAWYSGEPDKLHEVYQVTNGLSAVLDPKFTNMGSPEDTLLSQRSRYFWGNPPQPGEARHGKLHIPLAGDISATSADLLYGEPPEFSVLNDPGTMAALDKIINGGLIPVLLEGTEIGSALGGWYLRTTWDPAVSDVPLFDAVPPDAAVPEWRSGRLVAVTFWRVLATDDSNATYRHLERHEKSYVYHALYKGSDDSLGERMPLDLHPETAPFNLLTDDAGRIETGATWLTAEYIPNMLPNRCMRGAYLGRSDYSGVEQVMDSLDEVWSSLMRDVRLGKGRVIVPSSYLDVQGVGRGARFDPEREFFTPVKALPDDSGVDLKIVQFDIRVEEHASAARMLAAQAVRGAGYSAQTFGEGDPGSGAATATEVQSKEKRSYTTRDRKIGYNKPPVGRLLKAALEVYVAKFGAKDVIPQIPDIEFPDGVQVDEFTTAQTIQMLDLATAASPRTKVRMAHPQWDDDQVQEEVDAILSAGAMPVEDMGDTRQDLPEPPETDLDPPEATEDADEGA